MSSSPRPLSPNDGADGAAAAEWRAASGRRTGRVAATTSSGETLTTDDDDEEETEESFPCFFVVCARPPASPLDDANDGAGGWFTLSRRPESPRRKSSSRTLSTGSQPSSSPGTLHESSCRMAERLVGGMVSCCHSKLSVRPPPESSSSFRAVPRPAPCVTFCCATRPPSPFTLSSSSSSRSS